MYLEGCPISPRPNAAVVPYCPKQTHALSSVVYLVTMAFYTIAQLAGVIVGTTLLLYLGRAVYRVYFHPLSKFPGPKYAAFSDVLSLATDARRSNGSTDSNRFGLHMHGFAGDGLR